MKKLIFTLAVLAIFIGSNVAFAAGQFGSPETMEAGQMAVGIGYFHSSAQYSTDEEGWSEIEASQNQSYVQISVGITDDTEIYVRAGGADIKAKAAFDIGNSEFKEGAERPFGTIGLKRKLEINPSFVMGAFAQYSRYSDYQDERAETMTYEDIVFNVNERYAIVNAQDIQAGITMGLKPHERMTLYAGPVWYWSRAYVEGTASVSVPAYDYAETYSASATYREKNTMGGFAGMKIALTDALALEAEVQLKSKASAGASLVYSF
ncbi:MAG: hypothetical protein AAB464_01545 [Patescibacteria group bacterium]